MEVFQAAWANVAVTAFGFLVAGLTFYLRFREVAQNDGEKKEEKDKEDYGQYVRTQQDERS